MKTSVLIIAHNEERYIAECIESLLCQTQKPDEIVLIVHNSTDRTREIAKQYPVRTVDFDGPTGIVAARIKGIESVSGEYILCIDGDSFAQKNWVKVMVEVLQQNILVGSWIKFKGTWFGAISNLYNKFSCVSKGEKAARWIWGPSFAFYAKDAETVQNIFKRSTMLSSNLNLSRNPDDYWLALYMNKLGNLEVTNKTHVTQYTKETSTKSAFARNRENVRNATLMSRYMHSSSKK